MDEESAHDRGVMTMRAPLRVFLTIDTEVYPISPNWKNSALKEDVQRDIYGITASGEYGLRYQLKFLTSLDLRAVCFVEALFASSPFVGTEPLRAIVDDIRSSGHDTQLHLHPEWTPHIPSLSHIPAVPMAELTAEHQRELFRVGVSNLRHAGAEAPCAFRAGDYAANLDTLKTASESGMIFDSSYNYCYRDSTCKIAKGDGPLFQPCHVAEVCEVPVSFFEDRPGHYRHAQVCAASSREMLGALEQAWENGWSSFVIVSHSFEFIKDRRSGSAPSERLMVRKRFERLCRFLAENRNRFQTCVFSGLEPSDIVIQQPTGPLKSGMVRTLLRYAEQAAGRIW
jgi:hypothetical protein